MDRGSFHGYHHHNLPRLSSSSSEMNHIQQGTMSADPNMINTNKNNKMAINAAAGSDQDQSTECTVREQDRFMPIANVIRIMRRTLPPHAKISDDAKETIQECVSEFIGFVTGEANDRCQREQRKTITAEDVLYAMSKLGFDNYVDPLSLFLHRFREMEAGPDLIRGGARNDGFVKRPSAGAYDYGVVGAGGSGGGHVGGSNYPYAHQMYHNMVPHPPLPPGAGYYGQPMPPPPPGFESPYGQQNKG